MPTWEKILLVGLAGGGGALGRWGASVLIGSVIPPGFPWATLLVNLAGCLFFGLVYGAMETHEAMPEAVRLYVLIGFLGAFTTFSTFAFDAARLVELRHFTALAGTMLAHTVGGLTLMFAGLWLGRAL